VIIKNSRAGPEAAPRAARRPRRLAAPASRAGAHHVPPPPGYDGATGRRVGRL